MRVRVKGVRRGLVLVGWLVAGACSSPPGSLPDGSPGGGGGAGGAGGMLAPGGAGGADGGRAGAGAGGGVAPGGAGAGGGGAGALGGGAGALGGGAGALGGGAGAAGTAGHAGGGGTGGGAAIGGQAGGPAAGGAGGGGGVSCPIKGDFDGDGTPDCASVDSAKHLSFFKGLGSGNYQTTPVTSVLPCWGSLTLPAVADFDGDGRDDIIATTNQSGLGDDAVLFLGQSTGTFQCPLSQSSASFPRGFQPTYSSAIGDFTNDGRNDVFFVALSGTSGSNQVQWIVLSGMTSGSNLLKLTATLVPFILGSEGSANPISTQHLDADANLDVVVSADIRGMGDGVDTAQTINVYGNGDGTFRCGPGQTVAVPNPTQVTGHWVCQTNGTYAAQ